jgi:hypothetical protein
MRKLGYLFLTLGFFWLLIWCAGSVGPLIRSIGIENFKKYPEIKSYSGKEVADAMRSVLLEYEENAHGVVIPAILMLAGGVLLDRAASRSRGHAEIKTD